MRFKKPPRKFMIDSFDYYEYIDRNDWNEPIYAEKVTVKHCRIDDKTEYSSTGNDRTVVFNALIFCYKDITEPMLHFKEQSKIVFNDKDHILTKVIENNEPYKLQVYSAELEVI